MDFIEAYCLNLSEKYLNDYKEASRVIIVGDVTLRIMNICVKN